MFKGIKGIAVLAASLGLLITAGQVSATTILDHYVGANAHGYGDVISSSTEYDLYNIKSMEVTFSADTMKVRVYTGFHEDASDPYHVQYGDLMISTNGWNPYGSAPYTGDDASTSNYWNYVFDTSDGHLYGGIDDKTDLVTSDYFFGSYTNIIYRNNQYVQRISGGTQYDGSSVDLSQAGTYVEYNILLSSLNITDPTQIGLRWGMTCANDVIEGSVNVPEPSALMLLGLGLLVLGATARKRAS